MDEICRRKRKDLCNSCSSSSSELNQNTRFMSATMKCPQRLLNNNNNNKNHLYLCRSSTLTLKKSEYSDYEQLSRQQPTTETTSNQSNNSYGHKTMHCRYVKTTLSPLAFPLLPQLLPLLLLPLLSILNISVIATQLHNLEASRPSRSFIAPSLPQFVPSSHVSYEDGRRLNGQASLSSQHEDEDKPSISLYQSSSNHRAQILSSYQQQQQQQEQQQAININDDALRFKRTPLVSSPISSLLQLPTVINNYEQDTSQINTDNQQQYYSGNGNNAADYNNNYNYNHHRYGWHGQESPVASSTFDSSSAVNNGDLLMSSSSISIDQLGNSDNSQPQARHHQTLQHRSSSTSFDGSAFGRSARQNNMYNSGSSNRQQQQADHELESERLRQRQHIQYHDQWPSMAGKCHKRTLNFCARVLPFNTTIFPNIIGDTNRFEVKRSLPFFGFLAKSSCNKRLDQLLCLLLEPPCHFETSKAIPPCKKFCRIALEGCGEYIPATLAMSSVFDCRKYPDSNDPNVCINLARGNTCSDDEFRCPDKTCIPRHWVCDGVRDCIFAADEANCTATSNNQESQSVCSTEEFKCDGKCVPKSWKCDRERDCLDGSDEESCEAKPQCGLDKFKCADGNGCIPKRWVCDGKAECRDGSDEQQCSQKECSENDFKCDNGICIPKIWRCDQQMDCKDGSDEFNCVYPTTVSNMVNVTHPSIATTTTTTTTTTVMPILAASSLVNETLLLPNVEALISDIAMKTFGGYGAKLQNNDDDRSDNMTSFDANDYAKLSDSILINSHNQNYSTGSIDPNLLLHMEPQKNHHQQQQFSSSSMAPVELMTSASLINSINSSSTTSGSGVNSVINGDTATTTVMVEDNSSQENMAKTVSNDAKTSYIVDDANQLSDIQIKALQSQNKAQQADLQHKNALLNREQTQNQLASISNDNHKQVNQHHLQQQASTYDPSIIIVNNSRQKANDEVATSVDSASSSSTPVSTINNQAARDSLTDLEDNNPKHSLNLMNNQHHLANQQRLQFQSQLQQQQQPPMQQHFPTSQHVHLQQARRLFSSFNKYTGQTHQLRAPKLNSNNKVPIYRSWINSLTGNHFHTQHNTQINPENQVSFDNVSPMSSVGLKRDRLLMATQLPSSTISATQAYSTSVSPYHSASSNADLALGKGTATTASIPPFSSTQGSRGAGSYFHLLSRYNLAGRRTPEPSLLIDYHKLQSQQSMINQRNRLAKHSNTYY